MIEKYADELYRLLAPLLPDDWEKLAMLGKVSAGFYDFVFYVRRGGEAAYRQCFVMARDGAFSREALMDAFSRMYDVCRKAQREIGDGQKVWNAFTFRLERGGKFQVGYHYEELGVGVPDGWKKQYLT